MAFIPHGHPDREKNLARFLDGNHEEVPDVAFHGTMDDFSQFKYESPTRVSRGLNRLGFWFDKNERTPNYFAGYAQPSESRKPNVIAAHISMKNPLIFASDEIHPELQDKINEMAKRQDWYGINGLLAQKGHDDAFDKLMRLLPNGGRTRNEVVDQIRQKLMDDGYDGIILKNTMADHQTRGGRPTDWYLPFRSEQIKSAFGNQGTFDPNDPDITKAQGGEVEDDGIAAYHGSPHDYPAERLIRSPKGQEQYIVGQPGALPEVPQGATVMQDFPLGRMRMDKIGTGEGAQSYGHGLYTAENEDVAQGYREKLAMGQSTLDNRPMGQVASEKYKLPYGTEPNIEHDIADIVSSYGDTARSVMESRYPNLLTHYDKLVEEGRIKQPGRMYEVRINAHPDHFLDWDKPLEEQSEYVRSILAQDMFKPAPPRPVVHLEHADGSSGRLNAKNMEDAEQMAAYWKQQGSKATVSVPDETVPLSSGEDLHKALSRKMGFVNVSKRLRDAGIKGIRYLDAQSRSAGEGTRNYVVFDDKLVDIKRKYAAGGVVKESSDGKEAREDRAAHGRSRRKTPLIIDQYPTQYVPHVGRQVMQTGGSAIVKRALELTSQRRQRGR